MDALHVGSGLADLSRRSLRSVWHPCSQMALAERRPPLAIDRAEGPWLIDPDGRRYFDCISSWWVTLFGHGDAGIRQAIEDQLYRLPHTLLAGCTHAPAVELAERLSARTEHQLGHCFYASDGASAVEIALKMSFHAWRNLGHPEKRGFVCLRQSYHGETLGALSVTDVEVFRDAYDALLLRPHLVMSPDARQASQGESPEQVAERAAADLESLLQAQGHQIAALILEPLVQCAGGMAMHHPHYLRRARALCRDHRVHLIADEIAVGFGRTGSFFAWEQAGTDWPDLLCLSKGITGGFLPLSAVLASEAIFQAFWHEETRRGFLHSHSYTGNPLACRAALAVLDRFEDEPVLAQNATAAAALGEALRPLFADPRLEHPRQIGMIWAVDVTAAYAATDFSLQMREVALAHGLFLRPIGRTVYLMPPYLLTPELIDWLVRRLEDTFRAVLPEAPLPASQGDQTNQAHHVARPAEPAAA